jgi:heme/copper-type cytochrome/quinol oxidase subunit 3
MTHALPAAPAPPPRRQVFVGTALVGVVLWMLTGSMLAIWILMRERALDLGESWLPSGVTIPEVPSNVMLIGVWGLCVFAQWAAWSARRADRAHTALALGLTALMAIALINAQAFIYTRLDLPAAETGYAGMFFAITGLMIALFAIGALFAGIAAFRFLGGRLRDTEVVSSLALYWYIIAVAFSAVWLIVYVTK